MDELQLETGPVNAYAKTFFWIWGLALLVLAGIKVGNTAQSARSASVRGEISWLTMAIQQTKNAADITDYLHPHVRLR